MNFIIKWNAGYGDEYAEIEARNKEEAMNRAYNEWKEEAENNADYGIVGKATDKLREEYL